MAKITVGYEYYMGLHMALCYGAINRFLRIFVGERLAWCGDLRSSDRISIEATELFGGGDREGGVRGYADVMFGEATQGKNAYLVQQLGSNQPAYRGIASFVFIGPSNPLSYEDSNGHFRTNGFITSNNSYLKPWSFMVERTTDGWSDDTPWYPEKARIFLLTPTYDPPSYGLYATIRLDPIANATTLGGLQEGVGAGYALALNAPPGQLMQIRPTTGWNYDNAGDFWTCNYRVASVERGYEINDVNNYTSSGAAVAAAVANGFQSVPYTENPYYFWIYDSLLTDNEEFLTLEIYASNDCSGDLYGMNPAHIIYQCLTDPEWGMGYPIAQVDQSSFIAAADVLYDEGLGLCMIWNQQESIENFVQIVLDHAGAVLYADRRTGKFALKLLRGDYSSNVDEFGEDEIVSVENFQRVGYGETINEITVVYRDLLTNRDNAVTVQDLANIQAQGTVVSQTRNYSGLPLQDLAARIAMRDLRVSSTPLAKLTAKFTRAFWEKIPGDVVRITWPKLGLNGVVFRVLAVDYGTVDNGTITAQLAEDVFGLDASAYVAQQDSGWIEPDNTPSAITLQDLFEVPYWHVARVLVDNTNDIDDNDCYLGTVAAQSDNLWQFYRIWTDVVGGSAGDYVEQDTATFTPTAVVQVSTAFDKLSTEIEYIGAIGANTVEAGSLAMIGSGPSAEWVEVLSIDTTAATIQIARGVLDTVPQEHVNGERIWFAAETDAGAVTDAFATGDDVDVRLQTVATGGALDIADATPMSLTMDQRHARPYPPGKFRIDGEEYPASVTLPITITWAHRNRLQQLAYIVHQDEGNIGPEPNVTYNCRVINDTTEALIDEVTGTSSTSFTPDIGSNVPDFLRIELESERFIDSSQTLLSWQMHAHVVFTGGGGGGDPYFANVVLLMHFEGVDGSTTFTDVKSHTMTAGGNAQIDTAQFKYGSASGLFDGGADYVTSGTSADWALGTGDFTVECFIRVSSFATESIIGNYLGGSGGRWLFYATSTALGFRHDDATVITRTTSFSTDTWYHVAACRSGTTLRFFVDGVQIGTDATFSDNLSSSAALYLGSAGAFTSTDNFSGHMDEMRLTKGVARYTANFTPPSGPFPDF